PLIWLRKDVAPDSPKSGMTWPLEICVPLPGVCPAMKVSAVVVLWASVSESQMPDPRVPVVIGPLKLRSGFTIWSGEAVPMKTSLDGRIMPAKLRNWSAPGFPTLRIVVFDCCGRNWGRALPDVRVVSTPTCADSKAEDRGAVLPNWARVASAWLAVEPEAN